MTSNLYLSLIYKQLKGEITSGELHDLQTWEASSEQNRQEADSLRMAWEESTKHELPFDLDFDKDFAKVQSKLIKGETPKHKVVALSPKRNWLRIAAGVAVVLVVGFLLFNYLNNGSKVEWTVVAANDSIQNLTLPDGTKVSLNSASTLSYPMAFEGKNRSVKLSGEAFFEVTKNKEKTFTVSGDDLKITVLGTAFNVNDPKGNGDANVAVQKGKVRVEKSDQSQKVILEAKESASFQNDKLKKHLDKNLNDLAWNRKSLKFSNTKMKDVIDLIARQYKVEITLDNPFVEDCDVSGRFKTNTEVKQILSSITSLYKIEVQQTGDDSFLLIGGTCK